nr:hypothetical protein GCM10020063_075820 [Dactylosporangium thailandense]
MDAVSEHWLREWGVPFGPATPDLLSALAAAADVPLPEPAPDDDPFEPFGAGEMAVYARTPDDETAAGLGAELAGSLHGVALLQDETHADGVAQWILGRPG